MWAFISSILPLQASAVYAGTIPYGAQLVEGVKC